MGRTFFKKVWTNEKGGNRTGRLVHTTGRTLEAVTFCALFQILLYIVQ